MARARMSPDLLVVADALDMLVCAELKVDLIRVVYRLLRQALAYERGQVAADFAGQRELAVRERARAGKAGGDMAARAAVHAHARLDLRAAALLQRAALFDHNYLLAAPPAEHFERREYTGRASADYHYIRVHQNNLQTQKQHAVKACQKMYIVWAAPGSEPGTAWSGQRDSNSLPPPWQGGALPNELCPQNACYFSTFILFVKGFANFLSPVPGWD